MAQGTSALMDSLPYSAHQPLGLHLMGEAVGQGWADEEAKSFEDGFREFRQDFNSISKRYLPHRKPENLSLFFYNMWKTRIHPRAQDWYERKKVIANCASYPSSVSSTQDIHLIVAARMLLLTVWRTCFDILHGSKQQIHHVCVFASPGSSVVMHWIFQCKVLCAEVQHF